jgi:hypothetical protein
VAIERWGRMEQTPRWEDGQEDSQWGPRLHVHGCAYTQGLARRAGGHTLRIGQVLSLPQGARTSPNDQRGEQGTRRPLARVTCHRLLFDPIVAGVNKRMVEP